MLGTVQQLQPGQLAKWPDDRKPLTDDVLKGSRIAKRIKGLVQLWPTSVWGAKREDGSSGIGYDDEAFWKPENIPVQRLVSLFNEGVKKEPTVKAKPAKEKAEKVELEKSVLGVGMKALSAQMGIVLGKYNATNVRDAVLTCDLLWNRQLNEPGERRVLDPPGVDTPVTLLKRVRDNLLLNVEGDRATVEAKLAQPGIQYDMLATPDRAFWDLTFDPSFGTRLDYIVDTLERAEELEAASKSVTVFRNVTATLLQSSVLREVLQRLLRNINALRQGLPDMPPLSGLGMYSNPDPTKNPRLINELKEVYEARAADASGVTRDHLGRMVAENMVDESSTRGDLLQRLRDDLLPPEQAHEPAPGELEPLASSLLVKQTEKQLVTDWLDTQQKELDASRKSVEKTVRYIKKQYKDGGVTNLLFAWRLHVLVAGKAVATEEYEAQRVQYPDRADQFEEADNIKDTEWDLSGITQLQKLAEIDEAVNDVHEKAKELLTFAGMKFTANADGTLSYTDIDKATQVLDNVMNMFAQFWIDVRTYVNSKPKPKRDDGGAIRDALVQGAAKRRSVVAPNMHIGAVLLDLANLGTKPSVRKHMTALANHIQDRYKTTIDDMLTPTALSTIVSLPEPSFLDVVRALCLSRLEE